MSITLWQYLANRADQAARCALETVRTAADWEAQRAERQARFFESMGLAPLPARCDLKLAEYGDVRGPGYRGRKAAFQILPDCWATAGIYEPDPLPAAPCPGVLYVCGHGSFGHPHYQGHAIRWARRGYVCLLVDTIEQGDNPGEHHGLWTGARPDWLSLGYTAAGGELWNSLRALDVLASLPMVDPGRLGVTGVSGGGALSLFAAIADPRVKAVASSCGVSTPRDALVNRHLMGHCDCMYPHNPYGLDTADFAALIAPRPALFVCARHDSLFTPAEFRAFADRTRRVYALLGCADRCAYLETPGPHGERPEALAAIDRWFDLHVAGAARPPAGPCAAEHPEPALAPFNGAPPAPDRLDLLPELLAPRGSLALPRSTADWTEIRSTATDRLRAEVFGRLPPDSETMALERVGDARTGSDKETIYRNYRGTPGGMEVWLTTVRSSECRSVAVLGVAGPGEDALDLLGRLDAHAGTGAVRAAFEPRGAGWSAVEPARRTALLRAGALAGLTPVMLTVRDIGLLLDEWSALDEAKGCPVYLYGRGEAGVACLYAALLDVCVAGVLLEDPPASHRDGAPVLGILRVLDLPQAVGLMAPRPVALVNPGHWLEAWAARAYQRLGLGDRLIVTRSLDAAFARLLRGTEKAAS